MSEHNETEFENFLLRLVPNLAEEWEGATAEEINQIEQIAGRPLPPFYRWFLSRMGKSMGPLAYHNLDFSAQRILTCYTENLVEPNPRFLFIADYIEEDIVNSCYFYDLDASARGDAMVALGIDRKPDFGGYETLREMLAWGAFYLFKNDKKPHQCYGSFRSKDFDILSLIEPVMNNLGFIQPILTGSFLGLFERADIALSCSASLEVGNKNMTFEIGANKADVIKEVLAELAAKTSLEIRINK